MKNTILFTLTLLFVSLCSFTVNAQTAAEKDVLKGWDEVWQAYESNNLDKVWAYYSENAIEIYPDGSMASGLSSIKAGYEQFSGMLEGTPSWQTSKPVIRFITPDIALLTSDVVSDIKLKGGQQIGGKSTFALLLQKRNGKWLVEFNSQTPVLTMPAGN